MPRQQSEESAIETSVDMKLTKADLKARGDTGMPVANKSESGPKYPWGLSIRLDDVSLKKLGMDELPEVGVLCQVMGTGRVVSVSQRESQGTSSRDVEIQIERLNLEVEDESEDAFEAGAKKGRGRGGY